MTHWRSGTFWASAIFGWFLTEIVLAILIRIFGSDEMTAVEGITVLIAQQMLSLAAGYTYGRRQYGLRPKTGQLSDLSKGPGPR